MQFVADNWRSPFSYVTCTSSTVSAASRVTCRLHNLLMDPFTLQSGGSFASHRGAGAGPAGTVAAGPMLEAKLMNLIKGRMQKF